MTTKFTFLLLIVFCLSFITQQLERKYQIQKHFPSQNPSNFINLGMLIIDIDPHQSGITSFVEPLDRHLIQNSDFENNNNVILNFVQIGETGQSNKYFKTTVSKSTFQRSDLESENSKKKDSVKFNEDILIYVDNNQ